MAFPILSWNFRILGLSPLEPPLIQRLPSQPPAAGAAPAKPPTSAPKFPHGDMLSTPCQVKHGSAHRGANGVAMPTDEDDQDGHFFYSHPERGAYSAA